MKDLKLQLVRIQQAAFAQKKRVVIVFEGFDAAGKGTCIRHLVERLDPRSVHVIPVGKPTETEQGQHYLQRFWKHLPEAGHMVIFDRSWYGRVLVEKVEKLAPPARLKAAYAEINQFEKLLQDDGIILIKIFLKVSKAEQLARFKERLGNPFKNWKITEEDVRNRQKWDAYVKAVQTMTKRCPGWKVFPSDNKAEARLAVLEHVTHELKSIKVTNKTSERLNKLARRLLAED